MKRGPVVTMFILVAFSALAGKEEREFLKSELTPAVSAAEAKFKASCGCALKITLNGNTTKTKEDMQTTKNIADAITEGVGGYCTDAPSKKAVCQMKALELAKASKAEFTFKGGKGVATQDGQSYTNWEMMTRELDK